MKQLNKQEVSLKRKPLKGQVNRQIKFIPKQQQYASPLITSNIQQKSLKLRIKQNQSILNVSLIEGSSFISNKQDGSLDSMDKMLIGSTNAAGIDQKEFQDESEGEKDERVEDKGEGSDFDFTQIHRQYEKLIGRNLLLGEDQQMSDQLQDNSRVLPDQDDWQLKQLTVSQKKLHKLSLSLSPKKKQYQFTQSYQHSNNSQQPYIYTQQDIKLNLQKIQMKIDEMKNQTNVKKIQDISNNSIKILVGNLGNLSEIHQQRQNVNNSRDHDRKRNNQEDQQEFIDFVRQPDPQENQENYILNQNLQKKSYFPDENLVNQWEVSPMFQNLELQLQKQKQSKKNQKSANYQQILQALNSKQQEQTPNEFLQFFTKRQNWIKSHKQKSQGWKKKQLGLLNKMKKIIKNPHYDSQDSQVQ